MPCWWQQLQRPVVKRWDTDLTTKWEECQGHIVRTACGMKDAVADIFGKYNLSHQRDGSVAKYINVNFLSIVFIGLY